MFLPQPFSNGLARLPRNFFRGSLIPLPPFGGGRDATICKQGAISLSNAGLIIKWQTGWYRSTQDCHRKFSSDTHSSQATRGRKKMENETIISESNNLSPQPIQRYFSLAGGQSYRRLVPLYRVPKARIWLKLSPPIFFQLFI